MWRTGRIQHRDYISVSLPEHRLMEQGRRLMAFRCLMLDADAVDLPARRFHITAPVPEAAKDAIIHELYMRAVQRRHREVPDSSVLKARLLRGKHSLRKFAFDNKDR